MLFAGCDVGSTTTKAVIINSEKAILGTSLTKSTIHPDASGKTTLEKALLQNKSIDTIEQIDLIFATGYGRILLPFASQNVSEITCHAVGAHHLNKNIRSILDIGGQDCKAIQLNDYGYVQDFIINDKCAAGTGRFVENMSRVFNISVPELSELAQHSKHPVDISSKCSVFAETEVISLINQNGSLEDIAAGIFKSVAQRVTPLLRRIGVKNNFIVTGGGAKCKILISMLTNLLRMDIIPLPFDPQMIGALGAALLARKTCI